MQSVPNGKPGILVDTWAHNTSALGGPLYVGPLLTFAYFRDVETSKHQVFALRLLPATKYMYWASHYPGSLDASDNNELRSPKMELIFGSYILI